MAETKTANHIALLAPVPEVHLESALRELKDSMVAFASRDWELFRRLDNERKGLPVEVYIYASRSDGFDGMASWHAIYAYQSDEEHKVKQFRPSSTNSDVLNGDIFWVVQKLRRLEPVEQRPVAGFEPYGKSGHAYGHAFPPHRPLLVEYPL